MAAWNCDCRQGSVFGAGAARKVSVVRRHIAIDIVIARIVTVPVAALIAACLYALSLFVL
jgi:PiT family inorganic phosphate transporter